MQQHFLLHRRKSYKHDGKHLEIPQETQLLSLN
jgi:hypothetical protein